ncbi:MAG: hypothetical protein HY079_06635 [Elusimicrobia bacterium]|nr:hypothetical protein [Elusimicrobiota bacterium]
MSDFKKDITAQLKEAAETMTATAKLAPEIDARTSPTSWSAATAATARRCRRSR